MLNSIVYQDYRQEFDSACRERDSIGEVLPDNIKNIIHKEKAGIKIDSGLIVSYNKEIILYKKAQQKVDHYYHLITGNKKN